MVQARTRSHPRAPQLSDLRWPPVLTALTLARVCLRARRSARVCASSWVDGRFVHVLTPNIYRTLAEALQTFDYITKTGNFGFVDREVARWSGVAIMVRASARHWRRATARSRAVHAC